MACSFLVFRIFYSGTYNYSNLLCNLFLAWMPYIFSVLASSAYRFNAKRWWLIILLGVYGWYFSPPAPYIVTDFYYLDPRPPVPLWFDISLIAIFAFTGCFLAIASLRSIHIIIERTMGRVAVPALQYSLLCTWSCQPGGVFGEVRCLNSWDILLNLNLS